MFVVLQMSRLTRERPNSANVRADIARRLRQQARHDDSSYDSDEESSSEATSGDKDEAKDEATSGDEDEHVYEDRENGGEGNSENDEFALMEDLRQLFEGGEEDLENHLDWNYDDRDDDMSTSEPDGRESDADFANLSSDGVIGEEAWRLITASRSIKISRWEQFGTVKSIGGVHSGKILLFMIETEDEERILVDGNIHHAFSGGQIYIPTSKKMMQNQDFTDDRVVPTLPAMLMNLFLCKNANDKLTAMHASAVR